MGMRLNNKEESAAGTESALTGTQRRKKILALMRQTSHPCPAERWGERRA